MQKIAGLEGVEPTKITPPLYDAIDPEALDSLFLNGGQLQSRTPSRVEFTYNGYSVVVDSNGEIEVTELSPGVESSLRDVDGAIGD